MLFLAFFASFAVQWFSIDRRRGAVYNHVEELEVSDGKGQGSEGNLHG